MSSDMIDMFVQSFWETLVMVGISGAVGALAGLPLGVLLYLTDRDGVLQHLPFNRVMGVIINAVTATGGQIVGAPWTPLIMLNAPKASPMELKYATVIASVIGTGWLTFTSTVKVTGMPWYPAFAAVPSPVAPPAPNVPCPFAALTQVPMSISCNVLKMQMVGQLGDPNAPFHKELFEAISDAFEKSYNLWKVSTMVTNVLGTGPVPTFAPPYVPVGPVVGGVGTMTPGGFT